MQKIKPTKYNQQSKTPTSNQQPKINTNDASEAWAMSKSLGNPKSIVYLRAGMHCLIPYRAESIILMLEHAR